MRRAPVLPALILTAAAAAAPASAQTYEVLHQFRADYGAPVSPPVDGGDGSLYGVAPQGGVLGAGSVYRLTPDGAGGFVRTDIHEFGVGFSLNPFTFSYADGAFPLERLTPMPDGYLYGVTQQGGTGCDHWGGCGTVFRIDRNGGLTTLHSFTGADGSAPNGPLLPLPDGDLAGTAADGPGGYGEVFLISPDGSFRIACAFDGQNGWGAEGNLVATADGSVYGVTRLGGESGLGILFRIDASGALQTLHDFGQPGGPVGGLVRGSDGLLYGLYSYDGSYGNGGIFRSDLAGNVSIVHAFALNETANLVAGLAVGADGRLYGTSQNGGPSGVGNLFRVSTSGAFEVIASFDGGNGAHPQGALALLPDGHMWGAAPEGGAGSAGTIFRIDTSGSLTSAYDFLREEGAGSDSHLVQIPDGSFVGTTSTGGRYGKGFVFRIDAAGAFGILHAFSGADGATPRSGLLLASDGILYGTTYEGGGFGLGTIYSIDRSGGFVSLFSFSGGNGLHPVARLAEANDGNLYGVTQGGGLTGDGTAFRLVLPSSLTTLHSFSMAAGDGYAPVAPLVQASDGYLYGAVEYGGNFGIYGTLFRLTLPGSFEKIHDFNLDTGAFPRDGMIQAADGMLYGTTYSGDELSGTLYRVDPAGGFANVHSFGDGPGYYPMAGLVEATDGKLYGTTYYGGWTDRGTLYSIEKSGDLYSTLREFSPWDLGGAFPYARMIQASDGDFYGTAGVVFRLSLDTRLPEITGMSPSSGRAAGGTAFAVLGRHFRTEASVQLGGSLAIGETTLDGRTVLAVAPAQTAGSLVDVIVSFSDGTQALAENAWMSDFNDVESAHPFHDFVESVFRAGITAGCGAGSYCPAEAVTRAQMAVFLLKAEHGAAYGPPPCTGLFADVPCPSTFANWIEQLAAEGVTSGCGGGNYCPASPVTRAQMAIFLLKTSLGSSYTPPAAAGIFGDVPPGAFAADWIEDLYGRQITGGCSASPLLYCPGSSNTRGQMAVFLTKTFGLP